METERRKNVKCVLKEAIKKKKTEGQGNRGKK